MNDRPASEDAKDNAKASSLTPWGSWAALLLIWFATISQWMWVWGVVFIAWTLPTLRHGETYLVAVIKRRETPLLFWATTLTWLFLGLWLISYDFWPYE